MHALDRVSAITFYFLGACVIAGVVLLALGYFVTRLPTILHILDLPLLASGMLYGGSSLILSLQRERVSRGLSIVVFGFLTILFAIFTVLNFTFPFTPIF